MQGELGETDLGAQEEGIVLAATETGADTKTPADNKSEACTSCGKTIQDV